MGHMTERFNRRTIEKSYTTGDPFEILEIVTHDVADPVGSVSSRWLCVTCIPGYIIAGALFLVVHDVSTTSSIVVSTSLSVQA